MNVVCRYSFFKLDMTSHSKLSGAGRRRTHKIGLHGTGDQDCVSVLGASGTQIKFQLPDFVAAESQARAVVSLHQ
jgi:hypothetical protein